MSETSEVSVVDHITFGVALCNLAFVRREQVQCRAPERSLSAFPDLVGVMVPPWIDELPNKCWWRLLLNC